jgi:hypothetical protein
MSGRKTGSSSRPRPAHGRVRRARPVGGHRAEHRDAQVEREDDEEAAEDEWSKHPVLNHHKGCDALDCEREERRDRETGDRHEALGDARRIEAGNGAPERLVARKARAEREEARHERREAEEHGSPGAAHREEPGDRDERRDPAEEDELLDPAPTARVTKSESWR